MNTATDNRPRVGLGVCITKDGKVLFGQRLSPHGQGSWCFPGGHIEFGESFAECARREVSEEAGIIISEPEFITCTNDIYEAEGKHYVTVYMRAEWISGEPQVLEENKMTRWQWFDWDDLPSPLFLSNHNFVATGYRPV